MPVRNVYPIMVIGKDGCRKVTDLPIMTVVFNEKGKWLIDESEAFMVAEGYLQKTYPFYLEERFVIYGETGNRFSLPDNANRLTNPYVYPLEIAYGFVQKQPRRRKLQKGEPRKPALGTASFAIYHVRINPKR